MVSQFSSDAAAALDREVELEAERGSFAEDISSYYELSRCSEWIKLGRFTKVALQFPDHLLTHSVQIATTLSQQNNQCKIYVLGDTSYGSCCVDEVAAEHIGADGIIHFGHACLTATKRIPVLYIFGREVIDPEKCISAFKELFSDQLSHILVMYDVRYSHVIESLCEALRNDYTNLTVTSLNIPTLCCGCHQTGRSCTEDCGDCVSSDMQENDTSHGKDSITPSCQCGQSMDSKEQCKLGRCYTLSAPIEEYSIFYIGSEGRALSNIIINYHTCKCCSYNPSTNMYRKESTFINKTLGRRYYLMQKARAARTVGILAGTLATAGYREIIDRLKSLLSSVGKKYYVIVVGKLNVAKLANFMEMDVYVLVACPESSLIDNQEFYKPVVTPYEMELACSKSTEWGACYFTDYQELLPGGASHELLKDITKQDNDIPEFSFITGHMQSSNAATIESTVEGQIVKRSEQLQLTSYSTAAEYLQFRSWQGLEQQLGKTPVSKAVEGRSGTASGYTHEPDT
ncbi:2-(3-amino-3-carboxypropyl)histidine synthase subunit 2-like [Dysidea avara]|uniref:2-(3-amino-3-carboxypropyl)histidine synthase subunit 2-like n=1 Tax=Dysidea avara TaxID=196820 RepID=UPI003323A302